MKPVITLMAIAAVTILAAPTVEAAAKAALAPTPPSAMFKSGFNKCKLATLAAINTTTGKKFAKAKFDGKSCTWSSSDGNYVILLDTHPTGYLEFLGPPIGKSANGDVTTRITVRGASKAVLDTHSFANTHRYQKDLFAVYPQGVVQVSVDYSTTLPNSTIVAVERLLTHT